MQRYSEKLPYCYQNIKRFSSDARAIKTPSNFTQYCHISDLDDFGISGFLALTSIQIYKNCCTETPPLATILIPLTGKGMKSIWVIAG